MSVIIPWGEWATQTVEAAAPLVAAATLAVGTYLMRELPSWGVALAQEYLTQKRIQRAVNWGVTQINHQFVDPMTGRPRTVSIEAGNALTEAAESYMLTFAPQIAAQLGARLRPMILAEIAKIGAAPAAPIASPLPAKPVPQINK